MKRVLKPGGRIVIAMWAAIERNQLFAAIHTALRATTTPELSDLITAPFSWHSTAELKMAAEEAGFHDVQILTRSLPMVFEQGVEQTVRSFSATPVSPDVAALPQSIRAGRLLRPFEKRIGSLVVDGKVIGEMVSNIAHA